MRFQAPQCVSFLTLCWSLLSTCKGDISCNNKFSCVNETIVLSASEGGNINCYGFGSCAKSIINNIGNSIDGRSTRCWGTRACQDALSFDGSVQRPTGLRAYLALGWAKNVIVDTLECTAEASCHKVEKANSTEIDCGGFRACGGLNGYTNSNIFANGVLSLQNSILYNPSSVTFRGFFAGYNASIYCDYDNRCQINCHSNGCENVNLICGNASDPNYCTEKNSDNIFGVSCDETEGVVCPNGWGSSDINYTTNSSDYYSILENMLEIFTNYTISNIDDEYVYSKDYSECIEDENESTGGFNINISTTDIRTDTACEDASECAIDIITNATNICCSANQACRLATMESFDNLYCDGRRACYEATVTGMSNYSNMYLRGRETFEDGTADNLNTIMVNGYEGLLDATVDNVNYIAIFGQRGVAGSTISKVRNIYSGGYRGLYNTDVESNGVGEMNVYILGHQSVYEGSGGTITCSSGDTCKFYFMTYEIANDLESVIDYQCDGNCTFIYLTNPTSSPTTIPTKLPSFEPTSTPSDNPSTTPTRVPTATPIEFIYPTSQPSDTPTVSDDSNQNATLSPSQHSDNGT